jgi:WhiB family redox-sensing transcriptional regulator
MNHIRLGGWVSQAACRGADTRLFFPQRGDKRAISAAKAVCRTCQAIRPCRAWALAHPGERGIWGGLTEAERRVIRRQQGTGHAA